MAINRPGSNRRCYNNSVLTCAGCSKLVAVGIYRIRTIKTVSDGLSFKEKYIDLVSHNKPCKGICQYNLPE